MKSFIDMDEILKSIPDKVLIQLKTILKDTNLPDNDNSLCKIIESWLLKQAMFNKVIEHKNFKKVNVFNKDSKNGCIAITLSGSILSIGHNFNNKRKVIYTSIDFRNDVPKIFEEENAELSDDIIIGKPVIFNSGKIKKTSDIYNICIPENEYNSEEEVNNIIEINKLLIDNFIELSNSTFKSNYYDNDLSSKNNLFNQWIILKWFLIGGFDKHIFMARAKILWLELFSKLYKEFVKNKINNSKIDEMILDFSNIRFAKFIDEYKWYESEKKNYDIGLMKALEEIPVYKTYWDFVDKYLKEINVG